MIEFLRGRLAHRQPARLVIDVGGVGIGVDVSLRTAEQYPREGETVEIITYLHVREESLELYGFQNLVEKTIFLKLLGVSGIGPRIAMATLAVLDPNQLRAALAEGSIAVLTQVPGIGRKGAERLIIELRDKVGALAAVTAESIATGNGQVRGSVVEALTGLGFPAKQAEQAVDGVMAENGTSDTSTVLRKALATLGSKR